MVHPHRTAARRRTRPALAAAAFALLLGGCSGASEAAGGSGVVRLDIGRAPSTALLVEVASSTLQSFGFPITSVAGDLIQTDWRIQEPSGAVQMMGAQRVRDRAEVFIRSRAEDYFIGEVRMTFEVQVDGRWQAAPVSDDAREQYGRLRETALERLRPFMNQN